MANGRDDLASGRAFALKGLSQSLQEAASSSSSSPNEDSGQTCSSTSSGLAYPLFADAHDAIAPSDSTYHDYPASITQQRSEWYDKVRPSPRVGSSFASGPLQREAFVEGGDEEEEEDAAAGIPDPKKRKRNKPTLSCAECVDKKVKCDRGRPHCLSCIRRGIDCVYKIKAEVVEDNPRQSTNRRIHPPRTSGQPRSYSDYDSSPGSSNGYKPALFTHQEGTDLLLSNHPYTVTGVKTIFGIGSEYPFSNYWTQKGGALEVIKVLPNREQADILVKVFFDAVDPVYPLISRKMFYIDYEGFWELDDSRKEEVDMDFIALLFMVLAMGTQFLQGPGSPKELHGAADFYSSAYYQSLRLFSYLNRTSVRCLQSMVFMTYFLLNSGRASDGWAFSGTLIRQAYASGMNREPTLINPKFNVFQQLERRRLWHGIVCQDSFMSMSLKLPPAATHYDIDNAAPMQENDNSSFTETKTVDDVGVEDYFNESNHSDHGYVQSMYSLAVLAQNTISKPRSLSLPIAPNARQRNELLHRFRTCYQSFPDAFRAWDEDSIATIAQQGKKRLVRQIMFLTGLYWYCMTLIYSEGQEEFTFLSEESGKKNMGPGNTNIWFRGTLEAALESMRAFFVIHAVLGGESSVWWAFCHRAFSVSITIADLIKRHDAAQDPRNSSETNPTKRSAHSRRSTTLEALLERARVDVRRMLELLKVPAEDGDQAAKTRVEVLSSYL